MIPDFASEKEYRDSLSESEKVDHYNWYIKQGYSDYEARDIVWGTE